MKPESVYSTEELEKYRARLTSEQFEIASRSVREQGGVILEVMEDGHLRVVPVYRRVYVH